MDIEKAVKADFEQVENVSMAAEDPSKDLPESLKDLTPEEFSALQKRVTRKIDLKILPMMVYIYILNYLDRNNIASARLGGLEKELGLHGNQYATCISILFVGYITMQIPANMLFNKVAKPSLFITLIMTVWGVISGCTGAVQGYGGLMAIRVTLGIVEAGFFPAALFYLSCWYSRKELAFRTSILYSGSLISGAFASLIAAGILQGMEDKRGLSAWRWLFIIEGAITVASVPIAYFILPDMPSNTKSLNQQEKDIIIWKLKSEVGENDSDTALHVGYRQAMWLAVTDIKVWTVTGILSMLVAACGVTNFFPSVVETLGFERITTLCLTAPPYILAVIFTFIWSRHADMSGERFWHVVLPLLVSLASFIISAATLNTAARYFAMCIMVPSLYCAFVTILAWMSNCVPRPPMKRAIAIALMNCLSNSTSIWNAYLYPKSSGPKYLPAFVANCVFILVCILLAVFLRFYLLILNKKIENGTMNWERELGKGNDGSQINEDFKYLY